MNWQTLVSDLMKSGITQVEIAREVGLSQPAVSELATGRTSDVKWSVGEKLRALHKQHCGTEPAAAN